MWDAFHCVVVGAKVLRTRSLNLCLVSNFVELFCYVQNHELLCMGLYFTIPL
jgi:hypothetical protein